MMRLCPAARMRACEVRDDTEGPAGVRVIALLPPAGFLSLNSSQGLNTRHNLI
jgi:hypothetical protein